jgi:uncharacterized protein YndB with AHSA1/START domain
MTVEAVIHIDAPSETVYGLVADLPSMGKWSPECVRCDWLGGATAPAPGVKFKGRNRKGWRRWSTTGTIVAAEPGRELTFDINTFFKLPVARWRYLIEPDATGCKVTESTEDLRSSLVKRVTGPATGVTDRDAHNRRGMQATLEKIKAAAEATQPSAVEFGEQPLGGDLAVGVLDDRGDLAPVGAPVQPHAEPAAVAHIRRAEEAFRLFVDEHLLRARWRGAPDTEDPVAVMVVDMSD